jgi:predicted RNA-binding protein with PUA-like domain
VVHVTFRQKLDTPITLKELKDWRSEKGHPLEGMQMLAQTRMSVSKVSSVEWDFLTAQMKERGDVIQQ